MAFDEKVSKLLDNLPDQMEKDIKEFNQDQKKLEREMNDFDKDLKRDIANSRLLRK
jgi:hypothetical protein